MIFLLAALVTLLANISFAASLPQIIAVGSKFFTANGDQFYIKGIAYQLVSTDPLLDEGQCKRDAASMQKLGANTIRVYHVDATGDHSGCMSAFENAGIYLFVDLDTFDTQIDQDSPTWNQTQLTRFEAILDEFQKFDNTAGLFVGNEVLTRGDHFRKYTRVYEIMLRRLYLTGNGSAAAPYVKAALRDIKSYRDLKHYRKIPIGYSAADIPDLRPMLQNYMACGDDPTINADFYSLNVYEWCGRSSYGGSGYSMLEQNATGYNIPIFISETGCRKPAHRLFQDQASIFGSDMANTWSGAIIYEWIEEANDYGLISYGPTVDPTSAAATSALDGFPRSGTPSPVLPDYTNLQSQWSTLTPTGVKLSAYTASTRQLTPPACPTSTVSGWMVNGNAKLPSLGQTLDPAATASSTGSLTTSATPSASGKGAAAGGKEIAGMGLGLMGVMLGFVVWL